MRTGGFRENGAGKAEARARVEIPIIPAPRLWNGDAISGPACRTTQLLRPSSALRPSPTLPMLFFGRSGVSLREARGLNMALGPLAIWAR